MVPSQWLKTRGIVVIFQQALYNRAPFPERPRRLALNMIWVDYALLVVITVSALFSLLRGFVREAISLFGWILAFWVGLSFSRPAAVYLEAYIAIPSVRLAAAFFALFLCVLLLTAIANFIAGKLVDKTGISGTDRVLGMVFGAARGVVIIAVLVLFAGLTALPQDPWWKDALLLGYFERVAVEIRSYLPADLAVYFNF